jgi:hypothetical protein
VRCDKCGIFIFSDEDCYCSDTKTFCEDCGDDELTYNESIEKYILVEENKIVFLDDELSDLEQFEKVKGE